MSKLHASPTRDEGWQRSVWIVFASLNALILVIQLLRWTQGHTGLDSALAPTGFLITAMAQVFQLQAWRS